MPMNLEVIILAAGQGKRMYSSLPKVLHSLAGEPMVTRVVNAALQLAPQRIHVVVGHQADIVQEALSELPVHCVLQQAQLGTGHAVREALSYVNPGSLVLVLSADVPLIQPELLTKLVETVSSDVSLSLLVAHLDNPTGLGRIVRDEGVICKIVEEKDASEEEKKIKEIYTGICCATQEALARWLPKLSNENAQKEYYLTDIVHLAVEEKISIASLEVDEPLTVQGVNNLLQLQELERIFQHRVASVLMLQGVRIADASRLDIRGNLSCGRDVFIDVNAVFIGDVQLEEGVHIEPNCFLKNAVVKKNSVIRANSVLEGCVIGEDSEIGPFARLRAGTVLAARCKIGNFVETKKAHFDENSKANHLSYLGDVKIGKNVNIGAGTITCNYDGARKHQTTIEDGAFIGSDTQLVAPVVIGKNATIGAGSTIRKSVPAGELTLTVSQQKTIPGWQRPKKDENA